MFRWIKRIILAFVLIFLGWLIYEFITFPSISRLREQNPQTTSMIEARKKEDIAKGQQPKHIQTWVPLEKISPHLQRAVLAGEDANFATHRGFDWEAIQKAWEEAQKEAEKEAKQEGNNSEDDWIPAMPSFKRGASTITQQLAKNLYLSEERSFIRKGREAAITYFLERELSKKRILEIYLNVIEWGDGIYGAEEAAQHYFKKSADSLNAQEAAFLAAIIPSPNNVFNPNKNRKRVNRRARIISRGMPSVKMPEGTGK